MKRSVYLPGVTLLALLGTWLFPPWYTFDYVGTIAFINPCGLHFLFPAPRGEWIDFSRLLLLDMSILAAAILILILFAGFSKKKRA